MRSLLSQDYPNLEIIAINDRSTDQTGAILTRLAATHRNLSVVEIPTLPEGWLGKVHAMAVGSEKAEGEYLLFMDADVHMTPGTLKKCMSWVLEKDLEHAALIPKVIARSWLLNVMICFFAGGFVVSTGAGRVGREKNDRYVGVGAFNLVKASAFQATEGWKWLRMDVADDLGLALLMHRHGARSGLAFASEDVSIEWYSTVQGMIQGLEKNAYGAIAHYQPWRALVVSIAMLLGPLAILTIPFTSLWPLGLAWYMANLFNALTLPNNGVPKIWMFFAFLGAIPLSYTLLRSMFITRRAGGISWRGTHYSIEEMREGQRVKV